MKKIKFLTLIFISIIGFNSCIDDDAEITYVAETAGEFMFSNTFLDEYVLTPSTSGNLGERFTWNNADFGIETNINYEIQKSILGDFTDMEVIGSTAENSFSITIGDLLGYANEAGLDNDPETPEPDTGDVAFRIRASVGTNSSTEVLSPVSTLVLFLPESGGEEVLPLRNLFLFGDATAANWDNNANNTPMFRSPDNEDIYTFTGKFLGANFKFLEVKGQWAPQWGTNGGNILVNRPTEADPDPGTLTVDSDGYYTVDLNLTDETYTINTFDESGTTTYATIGIIGDSTPGGWDADTDMTQSTFDPHIWYINAVELNDGELKMRADNDWPVNWGNNTAMSGFGTQDGPNIPVTVGVYDIWFNDLDGGYTLIPVE